MMTNHDFPRHLVTDLIFTFLYTFLTVKVSTSCKKKLFCVCWLSVAKVAMHPISHLSNIVILVLLYTIEVGFSIHVQFSNVISTLLLSIKLCKHL